MSERMKGDVYERYMWEDEPLDELGLICGARYSVTENEDGTGCLMFQPTRDWADYEKATLIDFETVGHAIMRGRE